MNPQKMATPDVYAGMTETDCGADCVVNISQVEAAQRRLNEIEAANPRAASRNPRSPTVMESDADWLARNPHAADEFRRLVAQQAGKCVISGTAVCGHPRKGGLQDREKRDPAAVARFERAVAMLGTKPMEIKND